MTARFVSVYPDPGRIRNGGLMNTTAAVRQESFDLENAIEDIRLADTVGDDLPVFSNGRMIIPEAEADV